MKSILIKIKEYFITSTMKLKMLAIFVNEKS